MKGPAMTRRLFALALLLLSLISSGCRKHEAAPSPAAPRPYLIGIFQSVDSPTANEVRRGILQAFAEAGLRDGRDIVVTIRIANNDIAEVQRIARDLSGRADMIMPLSTQALQAAILASTKAPIVFGAVAVPYLIGAGRSAENHLANVTGVVSTGPVSQTMDLIREVLPKARRVGSLWTSSEINSEYYLDLARQAAPGLGFELMAAPVTRPTEILRSLQRLLNEKIDILFPMSDNTLNSSFDIIGRAAEENATPLFASFLRSVEFGACAALGIDFYEMGLKTGRLAVRVIQGESPGQIPIQSMETIKLYLNLAAAARQGVTFPKAVLDRADRILNRPGAAGAAPSPLPE
jgi:putative ABC transport system substrate-binding protein